MLRLFWFCWWEWFLLAAFHFRRRIRHIQEAELKKQIEEENERLEDIKEFEEYVQTDEYVEDKAKDELGLARKNEILFQSEK
mgnify:CR=1 FL=1